jgi:PTS system nitrogen regulatory IIA component
MRISDILVPERICCEVELSSKERVLEALSELLTKASANTVPARAVFDSLLARERLGSTGLGHGVAIPHGRLSYLRQAVGAFIRMSPGIDFDAPDGDKVDMVFGLLVPETSTEEHLRILSQLAECFNRESVRRELRASTSPRGVLDILRAAAPEAT